MLYKTKREVALEDDIVKAQEELVKLAVGLAVWVKLSPKMGRNGKREKEWLQLVDNALATLDYYPLNKNNYTYQD